MYASLLRRLDQQRPPQGHVGLHAVADRRHRRGGLRILRRLARDDDEVLYRTAIKAGDVFEIVTRPKRVGRPGAPVLLGVSMKVAP